MADLGLVTASDDEIFDRATAEVLTVVTADSDFGSGRWSRSRASSSPGGGGAMRLPMGSSPVHAPGTILSLA